MKKIKVSTPKYKDKYALVDDDVYYLLLENKWTYNGNYAFRIKQKNNICKADMMHRYIYEKIKGKIPEGYEIDHKDRNRLNNQMNNLRLGSSSNNSWNQPIRKDNTSGYKGVSFCRDRNVWRSYITFYGKRIEVHKKNKKEAAKQYNCMARILHGEFAYQNKI